MRMRMCAEAKIGWEEDDDDGVLARIACDSLSSDACSRLFCISKRTTTRPLFRPRWFRVAQHTKTHTKRREKNSNT